MKGLPHHSQCQMMYKTRLVVFALFDVRYCVVGAE